MERGQMFRCSTLVFLPPPLIPEHIANKDGTCLRIFIG